MHIWCHHDLWGPGVGSRCIRPRVSLIDHTTALHAVIEVLSALWEREFSGLGQTHDIYLTGLGYNYTESSIAAYVGSGIAAKRSESGDAPSSGSHAYKGGHCC